MEIYVYTYVYVILQSNKDIEVVNSFMGETKWMKRWNKHVFLMGGK